MKISTTYNIGDIVYIRNDPKQKPYDIVGMQIKPGGIILYDLDYMGVTLEMYDFQISSEVNELTRIKASTQNDDD